MTALAVTNTFAIGATITAAGHNTNYSDIVTYINNRNAGSTTWDALSVASATNVPGIFNNSTGMQDILRCQDNGTNVLLVPNGGIITMANQSGCRVYTNAGGQTIATVTTAKVQFRSKTYDTQSEFDAVTNYRFIATVAGKYLIMAHLKFTETTDVTNTTIYIYKNGAIAAEETKLGGSNTIAYLLIQDILSLAANDYVEIFMNNGAGSTITLGSAEKDSFLSIAKVA